MPLKTFHINKKQQDGGIETISIYMTESGTESYPMYCITLNCIGDCTLILSVKSEEDDIWYDFGVPSKEIVKVLIKELYSVLSKE